MTVTDQIKILHRKIKQNEAQYDLDIKAAKISALSSNNLGLKPSTVEQAKFEYSPLGKIFNKGLLKRLKNIEDKNEELLKTTRSKTENIKEITDFIKKPLSPEAKALTEKIRTIQKDVDHRKLKITGGNKVTYDFSDYKTFNKLSEDLYFKKMIIVDAEMKQHEFNSVLGALSNYALKIQKYIEAKHKL